MGLRLGLASRLGEDHFSSHQIAFEGGAHQVLVGPAAATKLARGELGGGVARRDHQGLGGHHLIHEAELLGLLGPHVATGQDDVEGLAQSDQAWEPRDAAPAREQSEHDLGKGQDGLGRARRYAPVAGQRDLEATTQACAVDGAYDGLGCPRHPIEQGVASLGKGLDLAPVGRLGEGLDIRTGDEVVALARDENRGDHVRSGFDGVEHALDLVEHLGRERVDRTVGVVDGDDGESWAATRLVNAQLEHGAGDISENGFLRNPPRDPRTENRRLRFPAAVPTPLSAPAHALRAHWHASASASQPGGEGKNRPRPIHPMQFGDCRSWKLH